VRRWLKGLVAGALGSLLSGLPATSPAEGAKTPRIAIVIDDMGNALRPGRAALALPGQLTYAFLPHTPHAGRLAQQASRLGKEVMLHLPMEAEQDLPLGPGGLLRNMERDEFRYTLDAALASVPHVTGVNNHMGSLLTSDRAAMQWLMQDLSRKGLFFIDSRTSRATVAEQQARDGAVAVARRDVFLDSSRDPREVRRQFRRLVKLAVERGSALAIGHPYRETLAVLADELPRLHGMGIELVPASRLTMIQLRRDPWPVSSSRSPKVAKNSKPSPSSTCCDEPASK
jgi:polysaccharide deacetylase 2 family uncharacterized protein YibQ